MVNNFRIFPFIQGIIVILLLVFTVLIRSVCYSQSTFKVHFTSPYLDRVLGGVISDSDNLILVGSREYDQGSVGGMLYYIDCWGDTLSEYYSKPDTISRFMGIFKSTNGKINVIGTLSEPCSNPYNSNYLYLWFVSLNPDLSIDFEKKFPISANYKYLTDLKVEILPGNSILIGATANASPNYFQRDDIILFVINESGDLQSIHYLNNPANDPNKFFDFSVSSSDSTLYVVGNGFAWNSDVQLLHLDSIFSISQITQLPNLNSFISLKEYFANKFLVSGQYYPPLTSDRQIIIKKQTLNTVFDSLIIGYSDSLEEPSYYYNLVKTSESEYLVSCTISQYIVGNQHTTLCLSKIDTNLNILWQRYYPINYPDYFTMGTFIGIDNTIWNYGMAISNTSPWQDDLIIYKLNQDGMFTGIEEEYYIQMNVDIFPCPFSNEISIKPQNDQPLIFKLYDLQGELIFSMSVKHPCLVNLSFLPDGMYLYQIFKNNVPIRSEKLIKINLF